MKLHFAFLTCFFSLSPSLCLERDLWRKVGEREHRHEDQILNKSLVTEVFWPDWEMPQPLQALTATGTGLSGMCHQQEMEPDLSSSKARFQLRLPWGCLEKQEQKEVISKMAWHFFLSLLLSLSLTDGPFCPSVYTFLRPSRGGWAYYTVIGPEMYAVSIVRLSGQWGGGQRGW